MALTGAETEEALPRSSKRSSARSIRRWAVPRSGMSACTSTSGRSSAGTSRGDWTRWWRELAGSQRTAGRAPRRRRPDGSDEPANPGPRRVADCHSRPDGRGLTVCSALGHRRWIALGERSPARRAASAALPARSPFACGAGHQQRVLRAVGEFPRAGMIWAIQVAPAASRTARRAKGGSDSCLTPLSTSTASCRLPRRCQRCAQRRSTGGLSMRSAIKTWRCSCMRAGRSPIRSGRGGPWLGRRPQRGGGGRLGRGRDRAADEFRCHRLRQRWAQCRGRSHLLAR